MLYNESLLYNEPQISYAGVLIINAAGLSSEIVLNNILVDFSLTPDYSNLTTIALIEYDIAPTGIITITSQDEESFAISEASSIIIYPYSENLTSISGESAAESGSGQVYMGPSGEIIIEGLPA